LLLPKEELVSSFFPDDGQSDVSLSDDDEQNDISSSEDDESSNTFSVRPMSEEELDHLIMTSDLQRYVMRWLCYYREKH
jgi:hypothetical protein